MEGVIGLGTGSTIAQQQLWKHFMFFDSQKTMEDSDSRSSDNEVEVSFTGLIVVSSYCECIHMHTSVHTFFKRL